MGSTFGQLVGDDSPMVRRAAAKALSVKKKEGFVLGRDDRETDTF